MIGQVSLALAIVRCATTYPFLERYPREDVFISVRSQSLLPARLLGLPFCPSLVGFVYNTVCYRRLAALEPLLDTFAVDERPPRRDWQQEDAHIQSGRNFADCVWLLLLAHHGIKVYAFGDKFEIEVAVG